MMENNQEGTEIVMEKENVNHIETKFDGITIEAILEQHNMSTALERVVSNGGAPGIDGMTVDRLEDYIRQNPGKLRRAILEGTYKPQPVKRVTIPKPERGKYRNLGIPTVIDRLVQQATAQVLSRYYDRTFSDSSCGFRNERGAQDAIFKVIGYTDLGYEWAVDIDFEKYFDTVNHSRLIRKLSTRIKDRRVISLISKMLRSGVSVDGEVQKTEIGVVQGGPISPILSNIYLDELDKVLEKRNHKFVRYADDLICLCKSKRAALRTLENLTKVAEGRMLLKVNREKSGVQYITKGVKFLGYAFYWNSKIKRIVPTVHRKSKERLKLSLKEILRRNRTHSIDQVKESLEQKLRGWNAYFSLATYRTWLKEMDEWIRRRIRQLLWKTWKKIPTRYRALIKLGCPEDKAYQWANTRKGYWRIANSHILKTTLTNDFLKMKGWRWLALSYKPLEWR